MEGPLLFGSELRRMRLQAGLTLRELAHEMNYSKGHLSKIERGGKRPPMALARRCDSYFAAKGRLQRLAEPHPPRFEDEQSSSSMARRDMISAGVGTLISATVAGQGEQTHQEGDQLELRLLKDQLHQMRNLGQTNPPAALIPLLHNQVSSITRRAARTSGPARAPLFALAARFAEFTGWQAQEAGDEAGALRWTAEAVELARVGGDPHLAAYALVRRALITFYRENAAETIGLAQEAQRSSVPPRIGALAAQREAQGHAIAGDEARCLHMLDHARRLFERDESTSDAPILGSTHLVDSVSMITGWCLHDLGRPQEAASVLDRECERLPPHAVRTRVRYGLRRALAHAASGEAERSCELADELLPLLDTAPSATVRADVRRLDRELSRFRSQRAVLNLQPVLARAIAVG
ncbi:helix-turn-helix domain-containing protein [Streptomyces tsukubensis]